MVGDCALCRTIYRMRLTLTATQNARFIGILEAGQQFTHQTFISVIKFKYAPKPKMHPSQTVRYEKIDFLGEGQVCKLLKILAFFISLRKYTIIY